MRFLDLIVKLNTKCLLTQACEHFFIFSSIAVKVSRLAARGRRG